MESTAKVKELDREMESPKTEDSAKKLPREKTYYLKASRQTNQQLLHMAPVGFFCLCSASTKIKVWFVYIVETRRPG